MLLFRFKFLMIPDPVPVDEGSDNLHNVRVTVNIDMVDHLRGLHCI